MSDTVQIRSDGFRVVVEHPYTSREGKAATAIVFFATVSLIASLVLIAALSISVWRKRARTASKPLLFINTHATVYFIFLTLSVIIQDVGGIITIEWIRKWEVYTGPICIVQAILKHIGDVSTAIWTLVLAIHSFLTIWQAGTQRPSTIAILGRQFQRERFTRWSTVAFAFLVIAILLILGPELTNKDRDDSFYGIAGEWCWITDGYKDARIIFGYFIMFFSAVASFILYVWMFYRVHRNLRVLKPASEYILSEKDQDDEYKIKLSKYMIYYPVAYFVCILPITVSRFVSWGGLAIPFDVAIFTDTIYQLLGLVNMIIYFFTPRMLPAKTVFPTGLNAEEEEYKRGREDKYANPRHKEEKHFVAGRRPPPLELALPQLLKAPERAHSRGMVPPPMYSATTGRKVTRAAIKQNWQYKRAAAEDATTDRPRPTLEAQLGWHSRHTSVVSSVNGLPPQARVNGLPSHPAERLSGTSSTRSSVSSTGALAGRRGIAVGFPVNPPQARSSQSSFESYASRRSRTRSGYPIQLEDGPDGSDTPTTISVPEVAITKYAPSVVSISLDADDLAHSPTSSTASTAIGSGEYSPNSIKRLSLPRLDVDVKTTGRGLEPPSALSSAEPLSGTVFQMVTRPGVYIVGRGM